MLYTRGVDIDQVSVGIIGVLVSVVDVRAVRRRLFRAVVDDKEDEKATEQKYKWDEENRLLAADENGFVSNYWYDADGERTVKTSGENEAIYVNSEFSGGNTGTARFSLYVSPYLVAGQGGKYTKHIYIGSQRIVSKLGNLASYGADPRRIPYAGNEADGVTVNYKDKYNRQLQSIKDNYKTFDLPYNGQDNPDYVNGKGFSSNDDMPEAAQARAMAHTAIDGNFKPNDDHEKMQFYYHPDHLGSSSYITNLDGEVMQHIEYVPFGEVFIEERNNTWNTPYLFNAKEFDEETGMYYYGARYYEPRLSLWMSVDPMKEKYNGISSYTYALNNPVRFNDPDGKDVASAIAETVGTFVVSAGVSFVENLISNGGNVNTAIHQIDWKGASIDAVVAGATSLIFSGASTAKLIKKLAGTKVGRSNLAKIMTSTVENMITNISASVSKGEKSLKDVDLKEELFVALAGSFSDAGLGKLSQKLEKSLSGAKKNLTESTNKYRSVVRSRQSKFYQRYLKGEVRTAQGRANSLQRRVFGADVARSIGSNSAQESTRNLYKRIE